MNSTRIWLSALWAGLAFSLTGSIALTQQPAKPKSPLTVKIETGRFESRSGCKAPDDCPQNVWVPATEFKQGSLLWLRATIANESSSSAFASVTIPFPTFMIVLTDSDTGKMPPLTRFGCFLRPQCTGERLTLVETKGPLGPWVIEPRETQREYLEITREFVLATPGKFTVSIETSEFQLTPKENLEVFGAADAAKVKPAGQVKSNEVQFAIAP